MDAGRDVLPETRAVEDSVMADVQLQMMALAGFWNVGAERQRRLGLADAGDIVLLALDGQQRRLPDRFEVDQCLAVT